MEKLESLCTVDENVKCCRCYGKQYEVLQKLKNIITILSSNSTSKYAPKRIKSMDTKIYVHIHVYSNTFHNSQEAVAIQVSIHGWKDKQMWYIHTIKYYSALKRKEILIHATRWMDLEDIMLSEIIQSQKDKYCVIPFIQRI